MNLPAVNNNTEQANLPERYESAKHALAECERIDECKDWSDKAAALASYAKQAEDDELLNHARRIQVRAVRRIGELIEQIEPRRGGDRRSNGGQPPLDSRKAAARTAGLSEHQQKQATRVARVPENEFNDRVESKKPPTVTQMAGYGTKKNPQKVASAVHAWGTLMEFSNWVAKHAPKEIAEGFMEHEIEPAIKQARRIRRWLRQLENELCTQQKT